MNDFSAILNRVPGYSGQVVHIEALPARRASHAMPGAPLPQQLAAILSEQGIAALYSHQAAALDAARSGAHLGVVTATASGKTLCYQLPILETALADAEARALLLFPTKALAHDQLRALRRLADPLGVAAATLDGDTPRAERDRLRAAARVVLANPDILHRTLLPDHARWQPLLAELRYVVLDEAHVYRGVFGTHVALIMRRLRRICAYYGAAPQFVCCSATSANPAEHLAALVGEPVTLVAADGAPQGPRQFVFWNPPLIDNDKPKGREQQRQRGRATQRVAESPPAETNSGRRRSTNVETARLLAALATTGIKTLAFTRTRRSAELVLRYTREAFERVPVGTPPPAGSVAAYRAGYAPAERRRLESAFLNGELRGLVSTNALELGVDIGGVDAVLISGFPGSVASVWQQAGRAGRSQGASLAVLVAQDDPLDQFYMRHPEQFFARSHEHARVALENPYILRDQLRCAAAELPLHDADEQWFGAPFGAMRDWLLRRGELRALPGRRLAATARRPAADVNIRSADGTALELRDIERDRVIEQINAARASFEVYPGAIYLYQGDTYRVEALHPRYAEARRVTVDYFTQAIEETSIRIERVQQQCQVGPATLYLGVVEVTRQVTGYRRKEHYSDLLLGEHDLDLPPQTIRTIAVWWTVPEELCRSVAAVCDGIIDALHAFEHACIGLLPLFAQCDRADIGGLSTDLHPDTGAATIFVYDGVPGGVGIAQTGYEQAGNWWAQTAALLNECPCAEGCPACIQSPKCGNGNQHLSKVGAAAFGARLLGRSLPRVQTLTASETPDQATGQNAVLADLRGRLARARATPAGPRRGALLAALRFRLLVERAACSDAAAQAEWEALSRSVAELEP